MNIGKEGMTDDDIVNNNFLPLCLQDIYGKEAFPTTGLELDILKFRPRSRLFTDHLLLENV